METTIKEIAGLLRSTEQMATQFVQRVQSRIGQPVSHAEVLAAMQAISAKSLTMDKVVAKLQQHRKAASRRAARRQTARQTRKSAPDSGTEAQSEAGSTDSKSTPVDSGKQTQTILERLESVLQENWDRAEAEGLQPNRMSTEAFVNAVYQYTDRREGTRRRIMQAASQLDESDVLLTPALVADIVHELFEG
jgi:hypothetical protein